MESGTTPRTVELPPPAWGSPAHLAARRAEKEWTQHLRAHASADAATRKIGKHARYVDAVDVVVRYTLPPDWSLVVDGGVKEGDAIWELPESDEVLVLVLKASSQPFFQRTGEFSKTSSAFKTPPLAKPAPKVAVTAPVETVQTHPITQPEPTPVVAPLPPSVVGISEVANASKPLPAAPSESNGAVEPRRTFLPVAVISTFLFVGGMFLWLIPAPLRMRLNAWWSPILRVSPPGHGQV